MGLVLLGFNPWWDTEFEFEVVVPELALVRFVVEDYDASSKNDFIGQSTIPLGSLKQGECMWRGGDDKWRRQSHCPLRHPHRMTGGTLCVLFPAHPPCQDTAMSTSCQRTETSTHPPPSL